MCRTLGACTVLYSMPGTQSDGGLRGYTGLTASVCGRVRNVASDDPRNEDGGHLLLVLLPVMSVLLAAEVIVAYGSVDQ